MNLTRLHLLITHLPIFGTLIGLLILLYGIYTGSFHTKMNAYAVLLVAAVGGIIAFSTGEAAEETVENIQGIAKNAIEKHEEFAKVTLISIIALGGASLFGAYLTLKKSRLSRIISVIVLILSLICFGLASWTAYLGGKIRHTELENIALPIQNADTGHTDFK